ncbi:MAG TPA: sensor domain-containing diguanylate cyclase [bacterium]|jgi:two-component system cell cycle response regulator|nr:sensor domain-containing diguanylate cyclase [bacterium]
MTSAEAPLAPREHPWIAPLAGCALVLGLCLASLMGWLSRLGERLDFSSGGLALALAVLALGPLAFYGLSLERGKAAPALRSAVAPWILFADLHLCVQISGGLASPLWSAYPLLALVLARNADAFNAAALTGVATVLEAFPLWMQAHGGDGGVAAAGEWWPRGLALLLPALGLGMGLLSRDPRPAAAERAGLPGPMEEPRPRPAPSSASGAPPPSPSLLPLPELALGLSDVAAVLNQDLIASLELAFHAHPAWNALSLWLGDEKGVALRYARIRQGKPVQEARVEPGEGLLGLALREHREHKFLNIEPLSPAAAAVLPYAEPPYLAGILRVLVLENEGRLVGLLACDKLAQESFGADEIHALDGLSRLLIRQAQAADHIDRLQAQGGRTQKLYAAAKELSMGLEREDLLARFGGLLRSLVPCDSWALGMREEENAALERLASDGYRRDAPRALSLDRAGALAATLQQADGAVLFNSVAGAQAPAVLLEGLAGSPGHFLLAPLRQGGRLCGVLKLDRAGEPFSEEERDAAYIFATQAAHTLENTRLYSLHRRLATTDGLTGLYNHRYFQERLALELEQALRTGRPLSLGLTDIDFFKKFNDNFGHQEGDAVLRKVAALLKEGVRSDRDIVCRYGGEEFVTILPDCDVVEARQVMERLRASCAANLSGGNAEQSQGITLSIGISTFPAAAREQRDLIHVADEALYRAKHAGRNRVCSFKDV